jgi:hypothetical protein
MQQCLIDYVNDYNTRAKPFTWTWNAKTTSPDSNVTGTVALTDRLARPTVDTPDVRSDQGGELIKRGRDAQTFMTGFDPEFVILKTPIRTPVANTFAERWIGTLRRELLDRTIIWNRHQLERLVVDYIDHYNTHRPHRSLHQRPPSPQHRANAESRVPRRVIRSTRCDGLINEYRHAS